MKNEQLLTRTTASFIKSKHKNLFLYILFVCIVTLNPFMGFSQCPLPANVGNITGQSKACPGESKIYSVSPAAGATSYTWALPAGCTISGQNPFTDPATAVTVDFGLTFVPPGNITVQANNACGSSAVRSKTISAYFPSISGSLTGNVVACPGDTNTYALTPAAGVTYTWVMPAGVTIVSGQGTSSISAAFNAGFTSTGNISVTGSYGCGAGPAKTKQIWRNEPVSPGPITGSINACPTQTLSYSVAPGSNITNYVWTATAGATVISGQGTTNVDITFPAGFVQGLVSVQFQNGCGSTNFSNLTIRAIPTPPGAISGPASGICNSTQTYTIAPVYGATSYTWTEPAGSTILSGQGTTSVTISFPAAVSGNVSVVANSPCGVSAVQRLTVTGNIIIAQQPQNQTVCEATDAIFSANVPGGNLSFQWRKDGVDLSDNADFSGTQTATLTIIQVDSINFGNYDLVVTSTCAPSVTSSAASLTVNMRPPVPGEIIRPAFACENTFGVILSVPLNVWNTTGYFWETLQGAVITAGQGTDSITVDFNPSPFSGYKIRVWAVNGCGLSFDTSKTFIIKSISGPHISSGPELVCQGQTNVDYVSDSVIGATSYTWSVTSGITINSGQGTLNLNVDFDAGFNSGDVCITATNQCMTTAAACRHVIKDVPSTPNNIVGQAFSACNTTLTYSVPSVNGANSYNWTVPSGATISSGQGTTSVDVSFSGTINGQICVNGIGNCTSGPSRCKVVKSLPQQPGTITPGTGVFCANQTGVTFTIAAVTGATNYLWTVPTGATITAGAGTTSITVDLGTADGNVGVRAQNSCGNSGTRTYFVDITCRTAAENLTSFENRFNVYPNPASDMITVEFVASSKQNVSIKVTDILGKNVIDESRVAAEGNNQMQFDLKGINSGLYFITIKSPDAVQQVRIVKE